MVSDVIMMFLFQALDFMDWFTHTFRDPLIAGAPGWFAGLFLLETFIQLPLILVMLQVFWQGEHSLTFPVFKSAHGYYKDGQLRSAAH